MNKGFKSSNYIFRQTALGQAFANLGVTNVPLVRDACIDGLLRDKNDSKNIRPSRAVVLNVNVDTGAAHV